VAVRAASKFQPGFSFCQFSFALASLTKDTPTLAWSTGLVVVSKVTKTPSGRVPMIFEEVNGRSKTMSKCRT
jgi:hypothetical protein